MDFEGFGSFGFGVLERRNSKCSFNLKSALALAGCCHLLKEDRTCKLLNGISSKFEALPDLVLFSGVLVGLLQPTPWSVSVKSEALVRTKSIILTQEQVVGILLWPSMAGLATPRERWHAGKATLGGIWGLPHEPVPCKNIRSTMSLYQVFLFCKS